MWCAFGALLFSSKGTSPTALLFLTNCYKLWLCPCLIFPTFTSLMQVAPTGFTTETASCGNPQSWSRRAGCMLPYVSPQEDGLNAHRCLTHTCAEENTKWMNGYLGNKYTVMAVVPTGDSGHILRRMWWRVFWSSQRMGTKKFVSLVA